jgi:RNA polymerase sigma factor (sigma-70 family)
MHKKRQQPAPEQAWPCRVALISSNDLIAEGIRQGLEQHDGMVLHDRFDSHEALANAPRSNACDVILISSRLIQYPMSEFFQQVRHLSAGARVIVFSAEAGHPYLKSLMRAGVYGFVAMDASVDELCNAITAVHSGQLWFDKTLLDEMIIDAIEFERMIEQSINERISALNEQMTKREQDVFCLVMEGLSTREIAAQIHMSEPTVKQHLTRLFKKFDASNRTQLILSAFERVCPVTNMIKLFRRTLDRQKTDAGLAPLIADPLRD